MSSPAKSIFYFGIYVIVSGLALFTIPEVVLAQMDLPTVEVIWIRMLGLVVTVLGYYYIQTARQELVPFFRLTVHTRPLPVFIFLVLVVLDLAPPIVILFGLIDLLGAIWTGLTLRQSQRQVAL